MANQLRAAIKTGIRRAVRRTGYDLTPLAAGFAPVQRRVLKTTPTVIDVGANVGQFGERLLDTGYAGRIVSFEPSDAAFQVLSSKASRRVTWDVRRSAVADASGTATLNLAGNSVSSSLLDVAALHIEAAPASRTVGQETVTTSTLDLELSDDFDEPFYLKVDVQGFEMPVLRGAERTLDRTRAIQIEVSFDTLYTGQSDWLELCSFIQKRGFVLRYIENGYENRATGYMLQADLLFVRD